MANLIFICFVIYCYISTIYMTIISSCSADWTNCTSKFQCCSRICEWNDFYENFVCWHRLNT